MDKKNSLFSNNQFSNRLDMLQAISTIVDSEMYIVDKIDFLIELEERKDTELGKKEHFLKFYEYCVDLFSPQIPKG